MRRQQTDDLPLPPVPVRTARNRPAAAPEVPLPAVVLARDVPRGWLDAEATAGRLLKVRRGAYLPTHDVAPDAPSRRRQIALAKITAVANQLDHTAVLSHESAALLWGLWSWRVPQTVHLLQASRRSGRSARDVMRHRETSARAAAVQRSGLWVTSLEQTVVDCARTCTPLHAVVVADSALACGLDWPTVVTILDDVRGHRGAARARELLSLAAPGAESAWETACRVVVRAHGFEAPELQVPVETHLGTFYADMGWRRWRLLLEFDGAVKYSVPGVSTTQAVMAEKRRQHAVEDERWRVLRATAADLNHTLPLVRRLSAALPPEALRTARPRPHLLTDLHP